MKFSEASAAQRAAGMFEQEPKANRKEKYNNSKH
jgi:hypothetical protein